MWKTLSVTVLLFTLVVFARHSRSDSSDEDLGPDPSFPLPPPQQDPATPAPPGTPGHHEPFTPYDVGPASAVWRYEDLSVAEKEVVDLGRDVSAWAASQDAMVAAVKEQARIEAAIIAQRQLGLGDLGDTGVVP